jgi:site-specific recombinase XerD
VEQFKTWLATVSVSAEEPQTFTKLDINKFLGHLANQETTGKTRYRKVVAIKKFFAFLKEKVVSLDSVDEYAQRLHARCTRLIHGTRST